MFLFFDTETNGLPKNYNGSMKDLDNWPRMAQLGYALFDEEGKLLYKYCELVNPEKKWKFPTYESLLSEGKTPEQAKKGSDFFKDKGYSDEINERDGLPIKMILEDFLVPLEKCEYIIAHNFMFDYNVVGSEMIRLGLVSKNKPKKLCTKELSTNFCAISNPSEYYRNRGEPYKWPTLDELHKKLFGNGFEGAHDAMNDVYALSKCFFKMKELGVIKL